MRKIALLASVSAASFMSEVCETVIVRMGSNDVRLNKADYDANPDAYTLASKAKQADETAAPVQTGATPMSAAEGVPIPPAPSAPGFIDAVAPPNPSADTLSVIKEGSGKKQRFFAVYASTGARIEDMKDIDKDGYETEALAWAAVMAAKREPALQDVENPPHTPTMPEAGEGPAA